MKHVPVRTCIVTRQRKPKTDLVRMAIDLETGLMVLDKKGKVRSRGAHLTPDLEVYDRAIDKGILGKALGMTITEENAENARNELIVYIRRLELQKGEKKVSVRVKGKSIKLD